MRDEMEFEMLMSSVLHEVANPEPVGGIEQRVMSGFGILEQPRMAQPEAGVLLDGGIKEEGILASLWSGVRDLIFPRRLPALVLESRPVAVVDRMAPERGHSSTVYAFVLHAVVIFLIGFVVRAQIRHAEPAHSVTALIEPPSLRVAVKAGQMGGGGGQRGDTPVSKGHLPKLEQEQIVPPMAPPLLPPRIAIEPSIMVQRDLKLADNVLPNLGVPNSPIVGRSMGSGRGLGIGSGDGDGIGPGSGGNTGGGLRHVGGTVSAPEVLHAVDPEFSEQARKAKMSGNVQVYLWVDEHGSPTHIRVIRGIGMGLDEKAIEAVRQYKFKPAMDNGRPVTVEMYVDVNFQIF